MRLAQESCAELRFMRKGLENTTHDRIGNLQ